MRVTRDRLEDNRRYGTSFKPSKHEISLYRRAGRQPPKD